MSIEGKEVLIIEDVADQRMLLRRILENAKIIVCEADSVDQAFKVLENKTPHLILLDLNLPETSGFVFLERKKNYPKLSSVPVVVNSGLNDKESIYKAISSGASDYLIKPITGPSLLQKLKKYFNAKEFQTYSFEKEKTPNLKLTVTSQISEVAQSSFSLESPVKFASQTRIGLKGQALDNLGLSKSFFISGTAPFVKTITGTYIGKVHAVGITKTIAPKSQTHVFIVDDETSQHKVITQVLKKHGFREEIFSSEESALKRLKSSIPVLFLIDINLGGSNKGYDLIKNIRENFTPTVPIFVISTTAEPEAISQALEYGANDYLFKPLDQEVFASKLQNYLEAPRPYSNSDSPSLRLIKGDLVVSATFDTSLEQITESGLTVLSKHLILRGTPVTLIGPLIQEIFGKTLEAVVISEEPDKNENRVKIFLEYDSIQSYTQIKNWIEKNNSKLSG